MDDNERTVEDVVVDELLKLIREIDNTAVGSEDRHRAVKDAKVFMDDLNARAKIEIDDMRLDREIEMREKELEIKLRQVELEEKKFEQEKEGSKKQMIIDIALGVGKIVAETGVSVAAMAIMTRNFNVGLRFEDETIYSSIIGRENRMSMNQFLKSRIN